MDNVAFPNLKISSPDGSGTAPLTFLVYYLTDGSLHFAVGANMTHLADFWLSLDIVNDPELYEVLNTDCNLVNFVGTQGSHIKTERCNPSFTPLVLFGALDRQLLLEYIVYRLLSKLVSPPEKNNGDCILPQHRTILSHGDNTSPVIWRFRQIF